MLYNAKEGPAIPSASDFRLKNPVVLVLLTLVTGVLLVALAVRSQDELASILLSVLLALVGIGVGVWGTKYFSEKSFESREREKLESYAKAAFTLSTSIDRVLLMCLQFLRNMEGGFGRGRSVASHKVEDMVERMREYLLIIRTLALGGNANWQGILPGDNLEEVRKREISTIRLAGDRALTITEEEYEL